MTLLLMGCGTQTASEGVGSSASASEGAGTPALAVTVLTSQERSAALRVVEGFVRGKDVGQFSATATKSTWGAYMRDFAGDVVFGSKPRNSPDDVVLVAAVTGPIDTSSMHRRYGSPPSVGSGAIVVIDSTGTAVSRMILLDGRTADIASLGSPVETLKLA